MEKKVLLINPPEEKVLDEKQTGSKWPRTGLAYIAAFLRANKIIVEILDCKVLNLNQEDIRKKLIDIKPYMVGIGPFTEEIHQANEVCKTIKKIDKNIITVFGGPHVSALPERSLREFPCLDIIVVGEGEATVLKLARLKKFSARNLSKIKGIAYREENKIIITKPSKLIEDLDKLPYPAWDLFPLNAYRGILSINLREETKKNILELPILSARGCPFNCNFCFKTCRGLRTRDPMKIIDEIEYDLNKYGATYFVFVEGTFGINKKEGQQLCQEIIKRGLNRRIKWLCETRVNAVDQELLILMKKAGCVEVDFGVESGDERILRETNKCITIQQIKIAVRTAKKLGFKVACYFIIGHPFETEESIKKTYKLARQIDPDLMNVGIMIPYPGTRVWDMANNGEGDYRLLTTDWREYTKQRGGPLELKNLPLNKLRRIQSREYIRYYLRPNKIFYIIKNIPIRKIFKIIKSLLKASF